MGKTVEQLNSRILESNESSAAKSSEIESLQSSLAAVTLRKGEMTKELEGLTPKMNELSATKDSMQQENELLCLVVDEVTAARDDLQKELETSTKTSRDKVAALKDSLEAKVTVIENLDKTVEQLNSRILESNESSAAKSSEVESLDRVKLLDGQGSMQKELEELTMKMNVISAAKDSILQENELLRAKVAQITDSKELGLPASKDATGAAMVNLRQYLVSAQQQIEGADGNAQIVPHDEVHNEGSTMVDEQVTSDDAAATKNTVIPQQGDQKKKARRKLTPRAMAELTEGEEGELGFGDIAS